MEVQGPGKHRLGRGLGRGGDGVSCGSDEVRYSPRPWLRRRPRDALVVLDRTRPGPHDVRMLARIVGPAGKNESAHACDHVHVLKCLAAMQLSAHSELLDACEPRSFNSVGDGTWLVPPSSLASEIGNAAVNFG
jgi:hypothetical protein